MSRSRWVGALWGAALGLAAATAIGACFTAPDADVQFSCDLDDAPECPSGYTCRDDGCCHRDGSDFATNEGACRLVGMGTDTTGASTSTTAATGSSSSTSTAGSTSTATDTTDASTGTGATGTRGETEATGSGSTGPGTDTDAPTGTDTGSSTGA